MDLSKMTETVVVRSNRLTLTRKQLLNVLSAARAPGLHEDAEAVICLEGIGKRQIGDSDTICIEWNSKGKDDD